MLFQIRIGQIYDETIIRANIFDINNLCSIFFLGDIQE
jgi:hypothetical protein